MIEITEEEFKQFEVLKKIFLHANHERSGAYFICGESGEKDAHGLPEGILVCPSYGVDMNATVIYKR